MFQGVYRFNAILVLVVLGSSALLLMRRLIYLTSIGGGEFQHADWLLNYSSGIVRRGISGEFFLALSQITSINPLFLVTIVQAVLTVTLIAVLLLKAFSFRMSDLTVILLLSPALVLFWVNDTGGAFRKELLGLAVFIPLLFERTSGPFGVAVMVLLFAVAVFFHEGNLVFAPALTFALFIRYGVNPTMITATVVLWVISAAAVVFSLMFKMVPDSAAMCQRILDAGLTDRLCDGIFTWMVEGAVIDPVSAVVVMNPDINLPLVLLLIVILLLPCLWIASYVLQSWAEWLCLAISFGTMFLLYPIATDWSRWLSMQVFAMTFLILMLAERRGGLDKPVPKPLYALTLIFFLSVGIDQIAPMPLNGFVFNFFDAIGAVLS